MVKVKAPKVAFTEEPQIDVKHISGFGTMEAYKVHLETDLVTLNNTLAQFKETALSAEQGDILSSVHDIIFSIASATHSVLEDTCQSCLPVDNAVMQFSPLEFIEKLSEQYNILAQTRNNTLVALVSADSPALIETNSIRLLKLLSAILRDILAHNSNGTVMLEVRNASQTKYLEFVNFIIADLNTTNCLAPHKVEQYNALANKLEGQFRVEYLEDSGHQYRVELPVGKGTPREELHVPYQAKLAQKRILLIDERPFQQRMFKSLCERVNMEIDIIDNAPSSIVALEKKANAYNFIIVNNDLPDMSGLELIEFIQMNDKTPPIFLLSTKPQPDKACGSNINTLTLPIKEKQLYTTLLDNLSEHA